MAVGYSEVCRLIARGTYLGQQFENVFYYENRDVVTTWTPENLCDTFQTEVLSKILLAQNTNVLYSSLIAENLDGDRTYFEKLFPSGTVHGSLTATNSLNSFLAMSVKLGPENRTVRPGHKRFCGVTEEMVENGGGLTPAQITLLNTVGTALKTILSPVTLGVAVPVIVGFPHPAGAHTPERVSRVAVKITTFTVLSYLTTQNSRKIGHGT